MLNDITTIYIWNSTKLSEDLALGRVKEGHKAAYLFADIAVIFFLFYIFSPPKPSELMLFIEGALVGGIATIGILTSFQKNGGRSGTHFIDHFVCLTLPLFIKVNVIVWSVYAAVYHTTGMFLHEIPDQYQSAIDAVDEIVTSSAIIITAGLFFTLMTNHISRIALLRRGRSRRRV